MLVPAVVSYATVTESKCLDDTLRRCLGWLVIQHLRILDKQR